MKIFNIIIHIPEEECTSETYSSNVQEWQEVTSDLAMQLRIHKKLLQDAIADIAELKMKMAQGNLEMFKRMYEEINEDKKQNKPKK